MSDVAIKKAMKSESFKPIKSLNITFIEPISLCCTEWNYYNAIYSAYLNGHLPFSGSYTQQPAKIIDVIQTFDALYSETNQKQMDKQKKEMERLRTSGKKKR